MDRGRPKLNPQCRSGILVARRSDRKSSIRANALVESATQQRQQSARDKYQAGLCESPLQASFRSASGVAIVTDFECGRAAGARDERWSPSPWHWTARRFYKCSREACRPKRRIRPKSVVRGTPKRSAARERLPRTSRRALAIRLRSCSASRSRKLPLPDGQGSQAGTAG